MTGEIAVRANRASIRKASSDISRGLRGAGAIGAAGIGGVGGGGGAGGGGAAVIATRGAASAAAATTKWGNSQKFVNRQLASGRRQASTMFRDVATLTAGVLSLRTAFIALGTGVKEGLKFEKQLVAIKQIVGQSTTGVKELTDQVRSLSKEFGINTAILNQNAIELLQSGRSIQDVRKALPTLALLGKNAQVGAEGLAQASKAMIVWGNVFDQTTEQATQSFRKVVALAKTQFITASEIVEASTIMSNSIRTMGASFDEMLAIVSATKSAVGRPVAETARGLNTLFSRITTGDAIGKLHELGIEIFDTQDNFRGMVPVLEDLNKAFDRFGIGTKKTQELLQILGGVRRKDIAGGAVNSIDQIRKNLELLGQDFTGVLEEDAAIALDTIFSKVSEVGVVFTDLFKSIEDSPFGTLTKQVLDMTKALLESKDVLTEIAALLALAGGARFLGGRAAAATAATLAAGGVAAGGGIFVGRGGTERQRRARGFGGGAAPVTGRGFQFAPRGLFRPERTITIPRKLPVQGTFGGARLVGDGIIAPQAAISRQFTPGRALRIARLRAARGVQALGGRGGVGFGGAIAAGAISRGISQTQFGQTTGGGALASGFQGAAIGLTAFALGLPPAVSAIVGFASALISFAQFIDRQQREAAFKAVDRFGGELRGRERFGLDPLTTVDFQSIEGLNRSLREQRQGLTDIPFEGAARVFIATNPILNPLAGLFGGFAEEALENFRTSRQEDLTGDVFERNIGSIERQTKAILATGDIKNIEDFAKFTNEAGDALGQQILDLFLITGEKGSDALKILIQAIDQLNEKAEEFARIQAQPVRVGRLQRSALGLGRQAANISSIQQIFTAFRGQAPDRFQGLQNLGTAGFGQAAGQLPINQQSADILRQINRIPQILQNIFATPQDFTAATFQQDLGATLGGVGISSDIVRLITDQIGEGFSQQDLEDALKNLPAFIEDLISALEANGGNVDQARQIAEKVNQNTRDLNAQFGQLLQDRNAAQGARGAVAGAGFGFAQLQAGFRGRPLRPGASRELLRRQIGSTIPIQRQRLAQAQRGLAEATRRGDPLAQGQFATVIQDAISKLQRLGNAADRTGSIFENLNREEASQAGKIGNAEQFLFANREERRGMLQNEFAARAVIRRGGLEGLNVFQQRAAVSGLRQRGDILAREPGQFQGRTGDQIADELINRLFGGERGPEAENIAKLQKFAADELIKAAGALLVVAQAQERVAQQAVAQADPRNQILLEADRREQRGLRPGARDIEGRPIGQNLLDPDGVIKVIVDKFGDIIERFGAFVGDFPDQIEIKENRLTRAEVHQQQQEDRAENFQNAKEARRRAFEERRRLARDFHDFGPEAF